MDNFFPPKMPITPDRRGLQVHKNPGTEEMAQFGKRPPNFF